MSDVGPILFANDHARAKLLADGYVVTFRSGERTTGTTWWRKSRTGPKRGDCEVRRLEAVTVGSDRLDELATAAGFEDGDAWRAAIEAHHGDPDAGVLYEVVAEDPYTLTEALADE
jgi:hypothetical protein